MIYNSLQGILTTMIGFVTWHDNGTKRWPGDKVVKMPCKLLYIIQVKRFLIKGYNFLTLSDIKV